ncbi:MAG: YdcF family protein [Verrucomicrobiota bacterium]
MSFAYSILLKLLSPTSLCLLLLAAAALFRKRKVPRRACFVLAMTVLLICGNAWVAEGLAGRLEREYLPPNPVPRADAIIVLGGGVLPKLPPRSTVEIDAAGNRLIYAAHLFRNGCAPRIICSDNDPAGSPGQRPAAEDMAELLEMIGVPKDAIILETKAENTHEHGVYLGPLLREKGFSRVLLVTSARHMPRSMGVFKKLCPGIEFIPAPTDFRAVELLPLPWYRHLEEIIPTPRSLVDFSDAMHEYLGMAYYKIRGWM